MNRDRKGPHRGSAAPNTNSTTSPIRNGPSAPQEYVRAQYAGKIQDAAITEEFPRKDAQATIPQAYSNSNYRPAADQKPPTQKSQVTGSKGNSPPQEYINAQYAKVAEKTPLSPDRSVHNVIGTSPPADTTSLENDIVREQRRLGIVTTTKHVLMPVEGVAKRLESIDVCCRPDFGIGGMPTKVKTNHFRLRIPNVTLYRYVVKSVTVIGGNSSNRDVQGPKRKQAMHALLTRLENTPGAPVFASDLKANVYTSRRIEQTFGLTFELECVNTFSSNVPRKAVRYLIRLENQGDILINRLLERIASISPMESREDGDALQALNIVFAYYAHRNSSRWPVGRRVFSKEDWNNPKKAVNLNGWFKGMRGFEQSLKITTGRYLKTIIPSHAAIFFPMELAEFFNRTRLSASSHPAAIMPYIFRLQVFAKHRGTVIALCGVAHESQSKANVIEVDRDAAGPEDVRFFARQDQDSPLHLSGMITVAQYFRQSFDLAALGITNLDPRLPVLNFGTPKFPLFIPAELCKIIEGQHFRSLLPPAEIERIHNISAVKPAQNEHDIIRDGFPMLGFTHGNNPSLHRLGIEVEPKMLEVKARVISPPEVRYHRSKATILDGKWNLAGSPRLIGPKSANRWAWIAVSTDPSGNPNGLHITSASAAEECISALMSSARSHGVHLAKPKSYGTHCFKGPSDSALRSLFAHLSTINPKLDFLYIMMNNKRAQTDLYSAIKYMGDVFYGIRTIHADAQKLSKKSPQYLANSVLKINMALDGFPHRAVSPAMRCIDFKTTMVIGIDVIHPTGGGRDLQSITAMTASMGDDLQLWPAFVRRNQTARNEMLEHADAMILSPLKRWKDVHTEYPAQIIIIRDGLSEGQFGLAVKFELAAIRRACETAYSEDGKTPPKLSLIVGRKRTDTKCFPTSDDRKFRDANGNPKFGSVLDRGITRAWIWEFYMQPHRPIQGTARYIHYVVLHDEVFRNVDRDCLRNAFKGNYSDLLQDFVNMLCYCLAHTTHVPSVPAPVYYADKACMRARKHLNGFEDAGRRMPADGDVDSVIRVHADLEHTMYYV